MILNPMYHLQRNSRSGFPSLRKLKIMPFEEELFAPFFKCDRSPLKECQLFIDYTHLTLQGGFDELLCLNAIRDMEKYWYQIETVKKVLRYSHVRVLLCDEVGLGKT